MCYIERFRKANSGQLAIIMRVTTNEENWEI